MGLYEVQTPGAITDHDNGTAIVFVTVGRLVELADGIAAAGVADGVLKQIGGAVPEDVVTPQGSPPESNDPPADHVPGEPEPERASRARGGRKTEGDG